MAKDYTDYQAADFLDDDTFLAWLRQEDESTNAFWLKWLQEHPDKIEVIQSAKERYLLLTGFKKIQPQPQDYEEVWNHIESAIQQSRPPRVNLFPNIRKRWWPYAAVFALLLICSWMGYKKWHPIESPRIILQAGEKIKEIVLSDSTLVVLNKHAVISYATKNNRELRLQGEAFFKVRKKQNHSGPQPFTIQAGQLKIAVLGTSFSVSSHVDSSSVFLLEGKVKVDAGTQTDLMHPGEKLKWVNQRFTKEHVNVQLYMAWKDGEFHFEHTSLKELANLIKDRYGYDLVIKDKAALSVNYISGRISDENEETLWQSLSLLLNVSVEKKGKQIILIPK